MRPDDGGVDHVGAGISLDHLGQRFEHGIEHARFDPSSVAAEHAVPLAIVVGQVPPLRPRPRHPHHALEIEPVVVGRSTSAPALRRQQWPDQRPFLVRQSNALAQGFLQKEALNQSAKFRVNLCPRCLAGLIIYPQRDECRFDIPSEMSDLEFSIKAVLQTIEELFIQGNI